MTIQETLDLIVESALNKRARDIKILDLTKVTSITDYFIICTGDAMPQVRAIYEEIDNQLRAEKIKAWHIEGTANLQWVLMDYVDFVVHIFLPEIREFYSLERLWGDAKIIEIEDRPQIYDTIDPRLLERRFDE